MEYEEIIEKIKKIKELQKESEHSTVYALKIEKSHYEDHEYYVLISADNIISNLFTKIDDLEDDLKSLKEIDEEFEFTDELTEKQIAGIVDDYIYDFGSRIDSIENLHEMLITQKSYKHFSSDDIKFMLKELKENKEILFADTDQTSLITDKNDVVDWYQKICESNSNEEKNDYDYYDEDLENEYRDYEQMMNKNTEGYQCSECGTFVKCAEDYNKEQEILCEKCFDKIIVIESVKTDLLVNNI